VRFGLTSNFGFLYDHVEHKGVNNSGIIMPELGGKAFNGFWTLSL